MEKQTLESRLNITDARRNILRDKIAQCFMNQKNKYDVVDIMWECRDICTNATEDMYVCFVIGGIQNSLITKNPFSSTFHAIFSNQKP